MLCLTNIVLTTLKYARVCLAFFIRKGGGGGMQHSMWVLSIHVECISKKIRSVCVLSVVFGVVWVPGNRKQHP